MNKTRPRFDLETVPDELVDNLNNIVTRRVIHAGYERSILRLRAVNNVTGSSREGCFLSGTTFPISRYYREYVHIV